MVAAYFAGNTHADVTLPKRAPGTPHANVTPRGALPTHWLHRASCRAKRNARGVNPVLA